MTSPGAWWSAASSVRRMLLVLGVFFGTLSAGFTLVNQLQAGEPYWIATRGFVDDKINLAQASLAKRVVETQIAVERAEKRRLETQIRDKNILLQQNQTAPDALKRAIEDQITELTAQLADTTGRIDSLDRERTGRRP